jgi:hypothetical protein
MRTAERAIVIGAASQAAPWRAPSAQASANVNERRGDRVHKLGSSSPKAGPLKVLGSDATLIQFLETQANPRAELPNGGSSH